MSCSRASKISNLYNKHLFLFRIQKVKESKRTKFCILLWLKHWVSLLRLCGCGLGRHVVQQGFERHHSHTQLNSGQPELCLLVSSKHLWCPKNILEETGLQRNKPFWAPRVSLCPGSPSLSLWDTSLSFIFPLHSQFCLCDLYCISVGVLFPCSKETIIVAPRTLS